MGLRPVVGRLLNAQDDGPKAAGAAVLTYRFWTTSLNGDPGVIGKAIRLGPRTATVVGVLEPSVPYPAETELIANVVTSPHHLGATMVTNRAHRMTDLFGRLAPGVSLEAARAELTASHAAMMHAHPEAYSPSANVQLRMTPLRDQIAAPARTILLVLLAAAAVVFIIACSNVANLILARSVRRAGALAGRACSRRPRLRARSCCSPARACSSPRSSRARRRTLATTCGACWSSIFRARRRVSASGTRGSSTSIRKRRGASSSCRALTVQRSGASCPGATPGASAQASRSSPRATHPRTAKRTRARGSASWRLASS